MVNISQEMLVKLQSEFADDKFEEETRNVARFTQDILAFYARNAGARYTLDELLKEMSILPFHSNLFRISLGILLSKELISDDYEVDGASDDVNPTKRVFFVDKSSTEDLQY